MNKKVILVWFRNDLRTTDNEVLYSAMEKSDFIIPVYIFDPRYYASNKFGFENTGEHRMQVIRSSVAALQNKMQSLGGDLLTYEGYPEEIIPHLVQKYDVDEVYHHREVARRETRISELVEESLWELKRNLKHFIGHTLYHKEDLPFPIKDIPDDFNTFKKKIAKESFVRACLPDVSQVQIPPHLEQHSVLSDEDLSSNDYSEACAYAHMQRLLEENDVKKDGYTELSVYLSLGILSPAQVYHFFNAQLSLATKKMINPVLEGLLWRDYYRFMLKKYPNCFFKIKDETATENHVLQSFITGNTSDDEINQLVHKLNTSGWLTRAERETLALYYVYEMKQPWIYGASFFEQQLVDYAPATNYGFWSHIAGKGTSVKNNRSEEDWLKIKKAWEEVGM